MLLLAPEQVEQSDGVGAERGYHRPPAPLLPARAFMRFDGFA